MYAQELQASSIEDEGFWIWVKGFDTKWLSKIALWLLHEKVDYLVLQCSIMILLEIVIWIVRGEGSIYRPRGRGMDDEDARIGKSLWRVRIS